MKRIASYLLFAFAIGFFPGQHLNAQPYTTLRNPLIPGASQTAPNTAPPIPEPPPTGDGAVPRPEIKGDAGASPLVPSGQADPGTGTRFPTVAGDTYKAPILVSGSRRGESLMQYTEKYPYPQTNYVTIDGIRYQYIDTDSPARGFPKEADGFTYGGLHSVKTLSRFFVIAAVVAATVLMAFAAFGVIQGEQNAGQKVTHTAGGLMLLFMAFTIWKLILANMASLDNKGPWDANNHKAEGHILLPDSAPQPVIPQAPAAPLRSGIPVFPDSGN